MPKKVKIKSTEDLEKLPEDEWVEAEFEPEAIVFKEKIKVHSK